MAKDPATVAAAPPVRHPFAKPDVGRETEEDEFPQHPLNPVEPGIDADDLTMGNDQPIESGDFVKVKLNLTHQGERLGIDVESVEKATSPLDELVTMSGQLAVEFGATNEFTQNRIKTLRQDLGDMIGDVKLIDAQIAHLQARRTDAMLACSGINADLARLGDLE